MTIGELRGILNSLSEMSDWHVLNVYINQEKVSLGDVKLFRDKDCADLFIEIGEEKV